MSETSKPRAATPFEGSRRQLWLGVVLAIVLGLGVWALFGRRDAGKHGVPGATPALESEAPAHERPAMLFFADHDAVALVQERHEIPMGESIEENVEATLRDWANGPREAEAVAVLPPQVRVTQAFFDDEEHVLYVDFNTALVTQMPGGSAAEYQLLSALLRTVGANFPEVTAVQILVDGQPVESLGGHYDTSKPLRVAAWQ